MSESIVIVPHTQTDVRLVNFYEKDDGTVGFLYQPIICWRVTSYEAPNGDVQTADPEPISIDTSDSDVIAIAHRDGFTFPSDMQVETIEEACEVAASHMERLNRSRGVPGRPSQ